MAHTTPASKSDLTLIISNKTYSSWSLRPWLILTQFNIPFKEEHISLLSLYEPVTKTQLKSRIPSGKVPTLHDVTHDLVIWDSIAIAEYIAECFPNLALWPRDFKARAVARSISAEMHSGFQSLRTEFPFNAKLKTKIEPSAATQKDIARILEIWKKCRTEFGEKAGGDFLFGQFCIADAMYAPTAMRLITYGAEGLLGDVEKKYVDALLNLDAFKKWLKEANEEKENIEKYDKK